MLKFIYALGCGLGGAFLAAAMHPQCFHGFEALACGGEPGAGTYAIGFFGGIVAAAVSLALIRLLRSR